MRANLVAAVLLASFILLATEACHLPMHRRVHVGYHAPAVRVIGSTGIYWAYDLDGDYFYYNGYWYWCDGPYWYTSSSWGGGWVYVQSPPPMFLRIPQGHVRYSVIYRHPSHSNYGAYRRKHYSSYRAPAGRRSFAKVRPSSRPGRAAPSPGKTKTGALGSTVKPTRTRKALPAQPKRGLPKVKSPGRTPSSKKGKTKTPAPRGKKGKKGPLKKLKR